jgi:histidyl-tRNA synthetase
LSVYIRDHLADFCEDCQRRAVKNPLRVLDCKVDGAKLAGVPTIDHFWCADCRAHFEKVQNLLKQAGGHFEVVPRLVRGLDYYTRTVFEVTSSALGAQDALAAGGRYDKLVKELDGPDVPALGFAMGVERAIQAVQAAKKEVEKSTKSPYIFVAALGEPAGLEAFKVLQALRQDPELAKEGIVIEGGFFEKKLGAQMTIADRLGATHTIILGEDELQKGEVTFRTMKNSTQEKIPLTELARHISQLTRA